eukprot:258247-Rhodomonas_salina.1
MVSSHTESLCLGQVPGYPGYPRAQQRAGEERDLRLPHPHHDHTSSELGRLVRPLTPHTRFTL